MRPSHESQKEGTRMIRARELGNTWTASERNIMCETLISK